MRHVDQEECAYFVGNLAHAREIDDARIGAASANDQFGMLFLGQFLEVVVIDGFSVLGHAVRNDAVSLAGKIEMMAVGKVSAMGQIEAQDGVEPIARGIHKRRVIDVDRFARRIERKRAPR